MKYKIIALLTIVYSNVFSQSNKAVIYPGIKIGNQVWMSKNLDVNKFANGDVIPEAKSDEEWKKAEEEGKPAWCYYDNDPKNGLKFGKLYNWYAVNDPRGLAPSGWHIPSEDEWNKLTNYLGGGSVAGRKMKTKLGWQSNGNGTNESGFSALPGGFRYGYGAFDNIGYYASWWSSTEIETGYGSKIINKSIFYDSGDLSNDTNRKDYGFSIRCIKN